MSSNFQNKKENYNNALMVLTIDVGNGTCDKLKIFNINNYQEETYDFCAKHNLDFNTMKEINHQIENVLMNSGIFKNENNSKNNKIGNGLYIKKPQNKINKDNYLSKFKKKREIDTNKKVIKRYNEKPFNSITQRMKDSNKNSSNYSSLISNSKINTSSTKGTSIKDFAIKSNVKNAFNTIKANTDRKKNILNNSNLNSDIKVQEKNEKKCSCSYLRDSSNILSGYNNNDILFSYSYKDKNNENNNNNNKRKESIDLLNKDNITNKKEKSRKDEMMIIEFDPGNDNNDDPIEKVNSNTKDTNEKFSSILNSISLIDKDYNKLFINTDKNQYKSNKIRTESNEENNISNNLINKSNTSTKIKNKFNLSSADIIKNQQKFREDKIQNLKKLNEIELKKLYTFKPLINLNSNTETNKGNNHKRGNTTSRFDKLYDYMISYKENKKKLSVKYEKNYPFQPKINSLSSYPLTKISFNERLKLYSNKSKDNINKLKSSLEKNKNSNENFNHILNTERHLNLLKRENNKNHPLSWKKYRDKTKLLTDKHIEEHNNTASCRNINSNIYTMKKEKSFKKIFSLLSNGKGKISKNNLNFKNIPKEIKNILEPIFNELQSTNEALIESEFIFVCDKLYDSLKFEQKQKLLSFGKNDLNKKQIKEKLKKDKNYHLTKTKSNPNLITYTSEKGKQNINRVSSCETAKNKNITKQNNEIKKINYYFSKPKYMMQINNYINEDKKIRENKDIINNISLSTFLKNKNITKNENKNEYNSFNINNLVVQNINNKVDKEIKISNDNKNGYI